MSPCVGGISQSDFEGSTPVSILLEVNQECNRKFIITPGTWVNYDSLHRFLDFFSLIFRKHDNCGVDVKSFC